jgi:hypothetical protein
MSSRQVFFQFASKHPNAVVMSPMTYAYMGEPLTYINLPVLINVFVDDWWIVFAEVPKKMEIDGLSCRLKPIFREELDEEGEQSQQHLKNLRISFWRL